MNPILLVANLIFVPIEYRNAFGSPKILYMAGSVSGQLFGDGLYTKEEIVAKYPDIKEVQHGFLGINELYYGKVRPIDQMN